MSCCSDSGGGGGGGGGDCSVAGKISPNASTTASTIASESKGSSNAHLKEHDYIGLSEVSSNLEGTPSLTLNLNLKETELRLGPPGSVSPQRDDSHAPELSLMSSVRTDVEEKELFPIAGRNAQKAMPMAVSGAKRGFAEAMSGKGNGYSAERDSWVYNNKQGGGDVGGLDAAAELKSSQGKVNGAALKQGPPSSWHDLDHSATSFRAGAAPSRPLKEAIMKKDTSTQDRTPSKMMAPLPDSTSMAPPPKAAVVGWPPIRSFRKNTLAAAPKANEDGDGKSGSSALYVKVSMDGAPYLRKVDLKMYNCYPELSSALEKMFSCFTIGQCGTHGTTGRDGLSESKLMDFLHGSEYVLTYEDKDGDWMLVGDVPWEMFSESCKRLRIMKGSEAIGLAPRAMEKCRNRN